MQKVLIIVVALAMGMVTTDAADITVVDGGFNGTIENTGSGGILTLADSTGGWDSGLQDNVWVSDAGSAVVANAYSRGVGLYQVVEVVGDTASASDWTLSFDFTTTAGDNDLYVGLFSWNSASSGKAIDLGNNNAYKVMNEGANNNATAYLPNTNPQGTNYGSGQWLMENSVLRTEAGLAIVDPTTGSYSEGFTLAAGHDRVAIIFAGRNVSNDLEGIRIDNVAIREGMAGEPPTSLSASVSNGLVQLDWDDSDDPAFHSFNVYRTETFGSGYTLIASNLTASSYTDSALDDGATYFYVVSQVSINGFESGVSNWVTSAGNRPNILLIVVDDLNTWALKDPNRYTGNMVVPNIERLANSGLTFARACTAASICVPSRTAFISGVAPWRSGIYQNQADIGASPILQEVPSFFELFYNAGYYTAKGGKVNHGWNVPGNFFYSQISGNHSTRDTPLPSRADGLPLKGWGDYGPEQDWGVIDDPNNIGPIQEADMMDTYLASYAVDTISNYTNTEQPFFFAFGFFHPHYPWHAPQKYFDLYPLEEMVLAPVNPDDQDDIPEEGRVMLGFQHEGIVANNDAIHATRAYLACTSYVDAQIGRILDALDASPHASNTIVILISDHGYHVGEKQHWFKGTTWEEAVNCLFLVRAPGLTQPDQVSPRMVSLLDLYPTLMDLAGIEHPPHLDGRSLYPLLQDPDREWDHPAISTYNANLSIASEDHRYIRYTDGTEELYDRTIDPHEWNNVVDDVAYRGVKNYLNSLLPAPGEMAPDFAADNVIGSLTLDLNVQSTGPGGGYLQFSPKSMEGIGIVPMPETPGPLTVNAMFRVNRTITITPVNFNADWQIGGSPEQGTIFVQASNQTITGTLNYGSDLGSAYSAWSTFYGGDSVIGAASYDFDKDGDSNYEEYSVGGDPTDPADTGVKPTLVFEGENVRFNVPQRTGDSNLFYYIESTPNLKNNIWEANQYLTSEVESSGGPLDIISYLFPMNNPAYFFRVIVESD